MTEKFKVSLFGYSKKQVYEYIAKLSDELIAKQNNERRKLETKIENLEDEKKQLYAKKEELEKKIAELTEILNKKEDENLKVSSILLDARAFADELKVKASEQNQKEIEENSRRNDEVAKNIDKCKADVESIRSYMRKFIENADTQATEIMEKLESVEKIQVTESGDNASVTNDADENN